MNNYNIFLNPEKLVAFYENEKLEPHDMKISNFKIECNNLIEIYFKGILISKFLLKFILKKKK